MKKICIILLAGGLAFAGISWTAKNIFTISFVKPDADPVLILSKSFGISGVKNVEVSTSGGSISVSGDATNNATVEAFGQGNNGRRLSKDEIMQVLNRDYEFSVASVNGTLKAIARRKVSGSWKNAVSISFKIHTAQNVTTNLNTSGGSIRLAGLHGAQQFNTSGGSISFDGLSGDIDGHTSGGSITAMNSSGNIKAHTSGGSLNIKNLNGSIEMHTSGGSIDAQNVKGTLDLSTSGGSIHLSEIAAKLSAQTSGGSIHAGLISLRQDADLASSGGSVGIEVPNSAKMSFELWGSKVKIGAANNIQVQMNKAQDHATGSINNGGATLHARTSGGTVSLDFK